MAYIETASDVRIWHKQDPELLVRFVCPSLRPITSGTNPDGASSNVKSHDHSASLSQTGGVKLAQTSKMV
jgi:hypothetical protein